MVSSMEGHGELLTARDDVTYYCYSLGQALVNAVGLNTGGATQQKQTAHVICKKLFRLDYILQKAVGLLGSAGGQASATCRDGLMRQVQKSLGTPGAGEGYSAYR